MDLNFNKPNEPNAPISAIPNKPTKQVSLSWIITLLIVIIPLSITFITIGYFLWFQTTDAYIHTHKHTVKATEGVTILSILNEGDSVNIGDTLVILQSNSLEQWHQRSLQSINNSGKKMTPAMIKQFKQIMKSSNNARIQSKRKYVYLNSNKHKLFVTAQEAHEMYQTWKGNEIVYNKAKLDYLTALSSLDTNSNTNLHSGNSNAFNTMIISPIKGKIAKVWIKVNEYVPNGEPIMIIYMNTLPEIMLHVKNKSLRDFTVTNICDIYLPDDTEIQGAIEKYSQADTVGYVKVHITPINPIPPQWIIHGLPVQILCD